ncbi:hypothetical protein TWF706_011488 [Orbilia oligospora]|nr:hypothetical protein TWF706_011488 [Orbilia oligospora]
MPCPHSEKLNINLKKFQRTGKWLLNSTEYQYWLATEKQTLFCPGIPGAGKTVLTSTIIGDLYSRFREKSDVGIAYIYCSFSRADTKEQKVDQLLSSIIKQLSQNWGALPEVIKELRKTHEKERSEPSLAELSETLRSIVALYARVFIAIDALDECGGMSWARILEEMFDLQTEHSINLIMTSRFIPDIVKKFEDFPSLEIRARNEDIENYLGGCFDGSQTELEFSSVILGNQNIREETKRVITDFADGMFLLAQLYVRTFEGKVTVKHVKIALKEIQERQQVSTEWIVYSRRPLAVLELQHALGIEVGEDEMNHENIPNFEDVVSICAGLVVVDKERDIVRRQTRQFTAGLCSDVEPSSWRGPPSYWRTPLLYAAEGGYEHIVGRLLKAGAEANLEDNDGLTPLSYAFKGGYEAVVRLLLDVHKSSGSLYDLKGKTPLTYAAKRGNVGIMKLLLERGFDPDSGDPEFDDKTPLASAVKNGHGEVVKLLLGDSRVNRNKVSGPEKRTPLSYAAEKGYTKILEMLLDSDTIDPEPRSKRQSALFWAVGNGHGKIVKALLASGADYSTTSTHRFFEDITVLSLAALNGDVPVAKLLLENGADPNIQSKNGDTALSIAVDWGSEEQHTLVKLLLDSGADPNSVSDRGADPNYASCGKTALASAASRINGAEAVVKLLLDRGADPNSVSKDGRAALVSAVSTASEAEPVIKLLLDRGADPNYVSEDGTTALELAVTTRAESVVKLLLDGGANPNSVSSDGITVLALAGSRGFDSIVGLLLYRNADPEAKSGDGSTALSRAIQFRHKSTANLLRAAMQLDLESEDSDTESGTESDTESDSYGPEIRGSNFEVEWLDIFDI